MFSSILIVVTSILPPTAAHAVVDVFGWDYGVPVQDSGKLIGPEGIDGVFLNLTRFKMIERRPRDQGGGFRHLARFNSEVVSVESTAQGTDPSARRRHNALLRLAKSLHQNAAGPRVLGTVFVPESYGSQPDLGFFAIVHPPVEGTWYAPIYRPRAVETRFILPPGVRATAQMLADVEHAFDVLDREGVQVTRPAFTLTPTGRAVLTEYGDAEFGEPTKAMLKVNMRIRRAVLKGLLHNWSRDCSLKFRAAPRRAGVRL